MKLKIGVRLWRIDSKIHVAMGVALAIFRHHAPMKTCVVTSLNDGTHDPKSKHYAGEAVDLRTRDLTVEEGDAILADLRIVLEEEGLEILDERQDKSHFHIQLKQGSVEYVL